MSAGVLALTAVAFEEPLQAEFEALPRDAVEVAEDDDGGEADPAMGGPDGGVIFPDGEFLPIGPSEWDHPVGALNVEGGHLIIHHGTEDLGRARSGEGMPVPIEDKDGRFMEVGGHFRWVWRAWRSGARGRNRIFIFGIKVRSNDRYTTRVEDVEASI